MIRMQGTPNQSAAGSPAYVGRTGGIRILFVEDDEFYRENLVAELTERGFVVHSFTDATWLLRSLDSAVEANVIVLEWKLPKTSGIDLLSQLRQRGVSVPVVFLTSHVQQANEKLAFERGAVDFIDKSRGVEILASRLRLVSETGKPTADLQADKMVACGKLVLRPESSRAYWNGMDAGLTIGEYKIVQLLASNAGSYVTYRAIYDRMTYEGFIAGVGNIGYRTNVRSAIRRIRNKFRECDPVFVEIENYVGFGYCWGRQVDEGDPKGSKLRSGRKLFVGRQRGLGVID
jgi:two-component system, OmpR family, response regulator ChvI